MKTLNIKAIRIDGGTQSRAEINNEVVADYAAAINDGSVFPPIVVFHDGADYWLADGFHRLHAFGRAGKTSVAAEVHPGTVRDAVLYSLGANPSHGLRRTNADKRKSVLTALNDAEWSMWSDRKIADACGVSNHFVAALRDPKAAERQQENREASTVKKAARVGSDPTTEAKKEAPKPEVHAPTTQSDDMVTGDELLEQMQETQAENEQLQERVAVMLQDDKNAEIDKLLTRINGLEGRLQQAMAQIKSSEDTTKYHAQLIHKLRKLLGVDGHKEILAAVKALVEEKAEA